MSLNTLHTDKNNKQIFLGDTVILEGHKATVEINDFNQEIVVDSEVGQARLADVNMLCEVIETNN